MSYSLPCTRCRAPVRRKSPSGIIRFYCDDCQREREQEAKRFAAAMVQEGIRRGIEKAQRDEQRKVHEDGKHQGTLVQVCPVCGIVAGMITAGLSAPFFPQRLPKGFRN